MGELKSITELAKFLGNSGDRLMPIDDHQLFLIEDTLKVILPDAYKLFLRLMGNGAGNFMKGSSVFYNEVFSLKKWSEELVLENDVEPLPDDVYVFWMHQGYQAAYFKLNAGQDKPRAGQ